MLSRKVWGDYINTSAQPTGEHEAHTSSCANGPSIENRINLGFFHNSSEAIREAKRYHSNVDGLLLLPPRESRR